LHQKVLILGANGFIGSHLAERIATQTDWDVMGLDLASHRLSRLLPCPAFSFVQADLCTDFEAVRRLVARADVVLPLVAIATPQSYVKDPLRVFELTFEANLKVIRCCVEYGKRVVFASSSEVYGMCTDPAFSESESTLVMGPIHKRRWIYACSKQLLDRVIHAYGSEGRLRYTIFRPFNWIGDGLDDPYDSREGSSRVLSQFIGNVIRGEDIRLVDGGRQRRCFLYVEDAMDALMRILENRKGCADQQIFNIGDPNADLSIRELAHGVLRIATSYPEWREVARKVQCIDVAARDYYGEGYQDMRRRRPSIAHAVELLGWRPVTSVETALVKTLDAYFGPKRIIRQSHAPSAAVPMAVGSAL